MFSGSSDSGALSPLESWKMLAGARMRLGLRFWMDRRPRTGVGESAMGPTGSSIPRNACPDAGRQKHDRGPCELAYTEYADGK